MRRPFACLAMAASLVGLDLPALRPAPGSPGWVSLDSVTIDGRIDGALLQVAARQVWRNGGTAAVLAESPVPQSERMQTVDGEGDPEARHWFTIPAGATIALWVRVQTTIRPVHGRFAAILRIDEPMGTLPLRAAIDLSPGATIAATWSPSHPGAITTLTDDRARFAVDRLARAAEVIICWRLSGSGPVSPPTVDMDPHDPRHAPVGPGWFVPLPADHPPFSQRGVGFRYRALAHHGGSRASEAAVEAGLRWLVRTQGTDGCWPATAADGPERTRCTAWAVLLFLGAGYDHRTRNRHQPVMASAVRALLAVPATGAGAALRAQVLGEAYGMTTDADLRLPARDALAAVIAGQRADGAWDTVAATREAAAALLAGGDARLEVPGLAEARERLAGWVAAHPATDWDGLWLARRIGGRADAPAPAANGYRAVMTEAMYDGSHHAWMTFQTPQRDGLVATQERDGDHAGSWPGPDRLDTTLDHLAALTVYYRYRPPTPWGGR